MRTVRITDSAAAYLRAERAYLARFDRRAALAMVARLRDAMRVLADYPQAGRPHLPMRGVYRYIAAPYVVDYAFSDTEIVILAIRHGRQDEPSPEPDDGLDDEA